MGGGPSSSDRVATSTTTRITTHTVTHSRTRDPAGGFRRALEDDVVDDPTPMPLFYAGKLGSVPGLRGRIEDRAESWATDRPRSARFPEGQHCVNREENRPSGKRPRRPTPSAETRSLGMSPWVAPLDVVRIVAQFGRTAQDNIKDGTTRR